MGICSAEIWSIQLHLRWLRPLGSMKKAGKRLHEFPLLRNADLMSKACPKPKDSCTKNLLNPSCLCIFKSLAAWSALRWEHLWNLQRRCEERWRLSSVSQPWRLGWNYEAAPLHRFHHLHVGQRACNILSEPAKLWLTFKFQSISTAAQCSRVGVSSNQHSKHQKL